MQEHRQEPHQNPPQEHYAFPASAHLTSGLNPPDSVSLIDMRLNAYLDAICALMPADVPAPAIAEMRREMQSHLQTALVAMQELGYSPEEFAEHAFAQFGEPQVVAKHWRREWEKTLADTGAFWPSLKTSVKIWSAAHAIFVIFLCSTVEQLSTGELPFWFRFVSRTLFFGLPLLTGATIGMRARRRPVTCALLGYGLTLPAIALGVLLYLIPLRSMEMAHHLSGFGSVPWPLLSKVGLGMYFYSLFVLPMGFAGAVVTALGRRIQTRMRRQIAH